MSLLCIDSGNTRIKWAIHAGVHDNDSRWLKHGTATHATLGELDLSAADIDHVIAANVGGAAARTAIEALAARLQRPLRWVRSQAAQCDVINGYDHPEQLGADRWAALIGARHLHRGDALVVMCGTATTIDVLRADGRFEGGLILPGIAMMRTALASGTADLPAVAGAQVDRVNLVDLPRNTFDAIASGSVAATVGAIEHMARYLDPAQEPLCLISGGAAEPVPPRLSFRSRVVEHLVLEGLRVIASSAGR